MSGCCPEAEGSHLEGCRAVSLLSWALCLWLCWLSAQWKLLPEAGWALQAHQATLVWWEVSEGGEQGQSCQLTHNTSTGSALPVVENCWAVCPSFLYFVCSQNTTPQGCRCSLPLPRPVCNGMFAYPSHLEALNALQGPWAPTCLLQSTLSMAAYGASATQLPHHHLPPASWRGNTRAGAPELETKADGGRDGPSEQRGPGFLPGGGAVPAPKSRNCGQAMPVPQPEGKWECCCLPSSQFSLAASGR